MFISFKKNKIMLIIDSHTHIFKSLKGKISKGNTLSSNYGKITIASKKTENFLPPLCQKTTFTPEMLLEYMRLLNIDKAILVQNSFYGEMNDYIFRVIKRKPNKFNGAAYINLWNKGAKNIFKYIINKLKFSIIKIEFSNNWGFSVLYPGIRLDDSTID